ncbi:MAG: DEAD/DEAH box helicase [Flavobacteriaceae bacterium]|nr:DEAD/DEAH box helicase [Flavobacteriaceae bacterium]
MEPLSDELLIYHGTWLPGSEKRFDNHGKFVLWVEKQSSHKIRKSTSVHPNHLRKEEDLVGLLSQEHALGALLDFFKPRVDSFHALFPITDQGVLPSLEMSRLTGDLLPDKYEWKNLKLHCLSIDHPLLFLKEINFNIHRHRLEYRLGSDLNYWIHYSSHLTSIVRQHHFLPIFKPYQLGKKAKKFFYTTGWKPSSDSYNQGIIAYAKSMPGSCLTSGVASNDKPYTTMNPCWNSEILLQHFSEQLLDSLVSMTKFPKALLKKFDDTWLLGAMGFDGIDTLKSFPQNEKMITESWNEWFSWKKQIEGYDNSSTEIAFQLGIRLEEPLFEKEYWSLAFFVLAKSDSSFQIDLKDWWESPTIKQKQIQKQLGSRFERIMLVKLGNAARICPLLWRGMQTSKPEGIHGVSLEEAYEFLNHDARSLESMGIKVILPSWYLPEGRRRIQLKIKTSATKRPSSSESGESLGFFNTDTLVNFDLNWAIGDHSLSESEINALVQTKHDLVQFRGQWMEFNSHDKAKILSLLKESKDLETKTTVRQLVKDFITSDKNTVVHEFDSFLHKLLKSVRQKDNIQEHPTPERLQGELRGYQKKGLAWLIKCQSLGLNPCLADDMGLGKTIQVISLFLYEKEYLKRVDNKKTVPTLLVAPTSVLANWLKEIKRFAPDITCLIHHGTHRESHASKFKKVCSKHDVIITSFALARNDHQLLKTMKWHRIVVDEAQNIKNPKSSQAKALYSLKSNHRIALTGTPIENRLMDLWSLFHFLNPGFLGPAARFKKTYEIPIQRNEDQKVMSQLKGLVDPFIFRRLKTDKTIISDLPDKVEQKVYCHLTQEQATLYKATTEDIKAKLLAAEGMERRGIIISSLTKLKQLCNHPKQFLQDGSSFDENRSLKLKRLNDMIEVALEKSESSLVFTQFSQLGEDLERLFRNKHRCPIYFLQGKTSRKKRQQMIDDFQNPEFPASIFVLTIKAGGVGINLTRANHVFHFDRWWNPAVENQATDRAYRIGQEKKVLTYKMMTIGTLEEKIDEMLVKKQLIADSIVGTSENWITEMDDEAFGKLIELHQESIMET